MSDSTSPPSADHAPTDTASLRRSWRQTIWRFVGGLLLMVLGGSVLLAGLLGIFWLHTPGIGKVLGWMIVLGAALALGGWMTLKGE